MNITAQAHNVPLTEHEWAGRNDRCCPAGACIPNLILTVASKLYGVNATILIFVVALPIAQLT